MLSFEGLRFRLLFQYEPKALLTLLLSLESRRGLQHSGCDLQLFTTVVVVVVVVVVEEVVVVVVVVAAAAVVVVVVAVVLVVVVEVVVRALLPSTW